MPAPFEIRVFAIDSVSWTPIVVSFDCTNLSIKNTDTVNGVRMRTNPSDPTTQDVLAPGAEQSLAIPFHRYRFAAGSQPVFLQAVEGNGPVVVRFLV